jgi:thioredoxin-related protein
MGNDGYFGSYLGLASLAFLIVFAALLITPARANDDPPTEVDDRFANEPKRPKAESKIQFSKSWDEASAEAKRTGRRLMAYFTSDNCGWCRVLEKRTFTDAEVVELSKRYVCVEVSVSEDRNSRLADVHRIDSIPRTIIFTPDGEVIERRIGYIPARVRRLAEGCREYADRDRRDALQPDRPSPRRFSRGRRGRDHLVRGRDGKPQPLERRRLDRPCPSAPTARLRWAPPADRAHLT